jgi:hypothetical protein
LPCASFVTARAAVAGRGESVGCRLVSNSMSRDVVMVSTASAVGAEFRDRQFGYGTTLGRCGCRPLSSHCPCGLRTYEGCWPAAPVTHWWRPSSVRRPMTIGGRPATTAHVRAAPSTRNDTQSRPRPPQPGCCSGDHRRRPLPFWPPAWRALRGVTSSSSDESLGVGCTSGTTVFPPERTVVGQGPAACWDEAPAREREPEMRTVGLVVGGVRCRR